jgi:hypothetical protein
MRWGAECRRDYISNNAKVSTESLSAPLIFDWRMQVGVHRMTRVEALFGLLILSPSLSPVDDGSCMMQMGQMRTGTTFIQERVSSQCLVGPLRFLANAGREYMEKRVSTSAPSRKVRKLSPILSPVV